MDVLRDSRQMKHRAPSSAPVFALLIAGIGALTLVFAALIYGAQTLGSRQPPSAALAQLHLTECALPCWLGIIPGQTQFSDAVDRVSAAYPQSKSSITDGRIANTETSFGQIILMADSSGIVHRISLPTFNLKGVTLADAVGVLGRPLWVVGKHPVAAYYGCNTFMAVISGTSVDTGWRQRVVIIDIQDVGYSCPAGNP
ncbi:MAG: hypothetical protein ABI700_16895 [Chloroflexota bacterium]